MHDPYPKEAEPKFFYSVDHASGQCWEWFKFIWFEIMILNQFGDLLTLI